MFKKCVCGSAVLLVLSLAPGSLAQQMGAWTFDEGSGTVAKDISGNGNNGRLIGGPTWVPGKFGKALKFDGVDDCVEIPHDASLTPSGDEETVSVWINAERHTGPNNAQWQGILTKGSPRVYSLYTEASGVLHFSTGLSGAYIGPVSTGQVPLNQWVHVAVVVQGGQDHFYIDGEPAGVAGSGVTLPKTNTGVLRIGDAAGETGRFFQGMIDDVRLYDFAMTPEEIKELFNGHPPTYPKAKKPSPADGAVDVTMPLLEWSAGEGAALHNVYFGTSPDLTEADLVAPQSYQLLYFHMTPLTPGVVYYWRIDEIDAAGNVTTGDVWHFLAMPMTAYLPQPADGGTNVTLNPVLRWTAGQMANSHHVYFGADRQAVEAGAPETDQGTLDAAETWYRVTDTLQPDARYFWRVDETRLGGTIQTGPVWSFDTVLAGPVGAIRQWWLSIGGTEVNDLTSYGDYPDNPTDSEFVTQMEGPVDWADNYGTRLYGWLYPPQSGEYTFWIASDDNGELLLSTDEDPANKRSIATVTVWTASQEWTKETNQRSPAIALEAGKRYYIEALQKEGNGGDNIAVAWQGPGFTMEVLGAGGVGPTPYLPVRAYSPFPADGAVDTVQSIVLTWNAGEKALRHEVYFGDDANAVAAADPSSDLFKGSQSGTRYDTGELEWGKTFFWRVDEINEGEAESPWIGHVWKFSTANYIPVDDFESYNDVEGTGTRIYETWIDGYSDGSSGSTVGNLDPPFAETTIVHGGAQAMPMDYNNIDTPYFSEAYREFSPLMNWTGNGVTDLSLWIHGRPIRMVEDPAGTYTVTANSGDVWNASDDFRFVYRTLNGDGAISAKVVSMANTTTNWAKAGVMIRESLDPASSYAFMFPTPDGRRAFQNRPGTGVGAVSAHSAAGEATLPFWVKVERQGNQLTAYYSTDGTAWTPQPDTENTGTDRSPNPQSIFMANSVLIGLAVASNNSQGGLCTAVFSDVVVTGGASFQIADIGSIDGGNDPDRLYLTVQDSTNASATVAHPDAGAVNLPAWTEWKIPLSDLAGVNLGKVERLYLGVGDKDNPVQDGTGRIYIDDIRVTRP